MRPYVVIHRVDAATLSKWKKPEPSMQLEPSVWYCKIPGTKIMFVEGSLFYVQSIM